MDNTKKEKRNRLSTASHFKVCMILKVLDDKSLINLGAALGLSYSNLTRMKSLPDEMVNAWLNEADNVTQTSGIPCSTSLSTALEAIGHGGVASKVKTAGTCKEIFKIKVLSFPMLQLARWTGRGVHLGEQHRLHIFTYDCRS